MNSGDLYPPTESASSDPTNAVLRFEIIERESENEVRQRPTAACDHTQPLDLLNEALDRLAEVGNLLEIVARALINGVGR